MADAEPKVEQEGPSVTERVAAFVKEYGELVQKHEIDFATYPMFVPDSANPGGFRVVTQTTPVDIKGQPKKSPFVAQ